MRLAYLRGAQRSGLWRRQSLSFIATRNCTVVQHPIREYGNQSDRRSLLLSLNLDHPRQGLLDHHHHHHCRRRRLECNTRLFGTDVDGNIGTRLQLIWKELRNHVDDNNAKANDIDFAAIDELLSILHQNGSSTDCIDAEKHADVYVKVSELQHEQTHTHTCGIHVVDCVIDWRLSVSTWQSIHCQSHTRPSTLYLLSSLLMVLLLLLLD